MGKFWLVVLFCLGALLLVLVGSPLLLDEELDLEASIAVRAPRERVLALLEDPSAWNEWNSFVRGRDAAEFEPSGPARGAGAELRWTRAAHRESLRIARASPEMVAYELLSDDDALSGGQFRLVPEGDDTHVIWRHRGVFARGFFQPVVLFLVEDRVARSMQEGLEGLRSAAETAN